MTSLLDINNLAVVHLRTTVSVGDGKLCKTGKDIKTRKDSAVLLNESNILLNHADKFRIDLSFKSIYSFLCSKNLLFVLL